MLWILGTFCTLPTMEIKAITGLIPIHLWKLSGHDQLWTSTLSYNYTIKMLLERRHALLSKPYCLSLENMTSKQQYKIKSSISNTNIYLNGIFPFFNFLNNKFCLGFRLIDFFSSCFLFYKVDHHSNESKKAYWNKLNELVFNTSITVVVILDTSIKNNVTTSIAHVHSFNNPLKKMHYHVINITSTETKLLFALRYRINQMV